MGPTGEITGGLNDPKPENQKIHVFIAILFVCVTLTGTVMSMNVYIGLLSNEYDEQKKNAPNNVNHRRTRSMMSISQALYVITAEWMSETCVEECADPFDTEDEQMTEPLSRNHEGAADDGQWWLNYSGRWIIWDTRAVIKEDDDSTQIDIIEDKVRGAHEKLGQLFEILEKCFPIATNEVRQRSAELASPNSAEATLSDGRAVDL